MKYNSVKKILIALFLIFIQSNLQAQSYFFERVYDEH